MIYLLTVFLFFITIIIYKICKDVFHPAVIICATYTFSAFVAALSKTTLDTDISTKTFIIILLFVVAFSLPCALCSFKKGTINHSQTTMIVLPETIRIMFFLFIFLITVLYVRYTLTAAIIGGLKGGYKNMFSYAQMTLYDENSDYSMGFLLNYGLKVSKAIGYISVLELIQNIIYKQKKSIITVANVILFLTQCLFSTGRTKLFYVIIFSVSLIVMYNRQLKNWVIKDNFKVIKSMIIILVISLVLFRLIGVHLRGSIYGNRHTAWESLSTYIGGPIYSLNVYLDNITYSNRFGEETLYSFYGIAKKLGFDVTNGYSFLEFINYGNKISVSNNVYGAIRRYIHDYNYFSIFIVIIEGIIFGCLYERIKRKGLNSFHFIFYASSLFAVVFFFFEERIIIDVFSTTNAITLLMMYIIFKTFSYRIDNSEVDEQEIDRRRLVFKIGKIRL